jgi:hypothetical protein
LRNGTELCVEYSMRSTFDTVGVSPEQAVGSLARFEKTMIWFPRR